MKCGIKTLICLAGSLVFSMGAKAVVNRGMDGNPYHAIVERNVFDLKPPVPPPSNTTVSNTPPPNVRLTGITSILGNKRALFMVKEGNTPNKAEESYILAEGQRQGMLEVVEINQKAANVRVKIDGNLSVLPLDMPKLSNAGGGGQPPGGAPRMPTYTPPPPQVNNGGYGAPVTPAATFGGGNISIGGNNPNLANNAGFNNNSLSSIPTRTIRTGDEQPLQLSREEQVIMMEAERERTKPLVDAGLWPPLPPTELTPMLQGGNQSGQQRGGATPGSTPPAPNFAFPPPR